MGNDNYPTKFRLIGAGAPLERWGREYLRKKASKKCERKKNYSL